MPIMNPILRYAIYPFARVVELTRPKKEEKKESPKEENKDGKESKKETAVDKMLEVREEVIVNASGLDVYLIRQERLYEYKIRLTRPAHGVSIPQLIDSLTRNRELLEKSTADMYRFYVGNINQNKAHNAIFDLGKDEKIKAIGKLPLNFWNEKTLRPATQNALVARANIDLLIPLINMRGGGAEYEGQEALPINDHINALRDMTEKQACEDNIPPEPEPETDEWTLSSFLITAAIVLGVAFLLKAFM